MRFTRAALWAFALLGLVILVEALWPVSAPSPSPTQAPIGTAAPAAQCHVVGIWNLERFSPRGSRGFPENTRGGPSYGPRSDDDLHALAVAIQQMQARALMLNEVGGVDRRRPGRSETLDRLLPHLGATWTYHVGASGGGQRLAFLYDTRYVEVLQTAELDIPHEEVDGSDVAEKNPLVTVVRLKDARGARNDLVFVGLHLASGQHNVDNHDRAMALTVDALQRARGQLYGATERDFLMGGDLNANRDDRHRERFFDDLEANGWRVLATPNGPATRLAGVPLGLGDAIDYLIASAGPGGLFGHEVTAPAATVHHELATGPDRWNTFRARLSDHFPVTTCVSLQDDDD